MASRLGLQPFAFINDRLLVPFYSPTTMATLVLPGEIISPDVLPVPSNPSISLKLGPGLRHVPPSTITPTLTGALSVDHKKNAIWVENNSGRVQ